MIVMMNCTSLYCHYREVLCARRKGAEQMICVLPASVPDKENFEYEAAADRAKTKDPVSPSNNLTPKILYDSPSVTNRLM